MEEYYFDVPVSNSKVLCIGSITREEAEAAASSICDGYGYYLFVANADSPRSPIEVLAKLVSEEAARNLCDSLRGAFSRLQPAN